MMLIILVLLKTVLFNPIKYRTINSSQEVIIFMISKYNCRKLWFNQLRKMISKMLIMNSINKIVRKPAIIWNQKTKIQVRRITPLLVINKKLMKMKKLIIKKLMSFHKLMIIPISLIRSISCLPFLPVLKIITNSNKKKICIHTSMMKLIDHQELKLNTENNLIYLNIHYKNKILTHTLMSQFKKIQT